jgi:hypothetical protein
MNTKKDKWVAQHNLMLAWAVILVMNTLMNNNAKVLQKAWDAETASTALRLQYLREQANLRARL